MPPCSSALSRSGSGRDEDDDDHYDIEGGGDLEKLFSKRPPEHCPEPL